MKELGCDAYTVSCQKWTLGPSGTGLLYVRKSIQGKMSPIEWQFGGPTGDPSAPFSICSHYTHSNGTISEVLLKALGRSIEFLNSCGYASGRLMEYNVGMRNLFYKLMGGLIEELKSEYGIYDVHIISPAPGSPMCGQILSVSLGAHTVKSGSCFTYLCKKGYMAKPIGDDQGGSGVKNSLRFSFHGWVTEEEVRALVGEIKHLFDKKHH